MNESPFYYPDEHEVRRASSDVADLRARLVAAGIIRPAGEVPDTRGESLTAPVLRINPEERSQ